MVETKTMTSSPGTEAWGILSYVAVLSRLRRDRSSSPSTETRGIRFAADVIKNKSLKNTSLVITLVAAIILAITVIVRIAVIGVGRNAEDISGTVTVQEVNTADLGVPVKIDDNRLPEEFPSDLPIYEPSEIQNVYTNQGVGVLGVSVIMESQSPIDEVVLFYKEEFVASKWETDIVLEDSESFTLSFKGQGAEGFIGITGKESVTVISLTVGIEDQNGAE